MVTPRVSRGWVGGIRPIALAVIRNGDRILVWDDHNPDTGEVVAVPLAGGLEFGETGAQAIRRELEEEIRATATRVDSLGVIEDIFDWAGQKRHELHLVYDVDLAERAFYETDQVEVVEDDGSIYPARWRSLAEFRGDARLVPDGLLALIDSLGRARCEAENKDLVQRYTRAVFDEGDVAAVDRYLAPDFFNHVTGRSGTDDFKRLAAQVGARPGSANVIELLVAEGDYVIALITITRRLDQELRAFGLTFPASGASYTVMHVHIYRIAGGRIREHWAVRDDLAMLRQLGVELSLGREGEQRRP